MNYVDICSCFFWVSLAIAFIVITIVVVLDTMKGTKENSYDEDREWRLESREWERERREIVRKEHVHGSPYRVIVCRGDDAGLEGVVNDLLRVAEEEEDVTHESDD